MVSFEEAIANITNRYDVPDGDHVARIVHVQFGTWPGTSENSGRPCLEVTLETEDGYTIETRIGDFWEWASGSKNFMLLDFLRAVGLDAKDDLPDNEYCQGIEVVVRTERRCAFISVKSIRPFADDLDSVELTL